MNGVPIARILGIEIRVQLAWVIVLALIGVLAVNELDAIVPGIDPLLMWGLGVVVALGFFASSVAHDLAHALVARSKGVAVPSIVVSFFGGATPLDPSSPNPGDDLVIAASGPLASLGIGGACGVVAVAIGSIGPEFGIASTMLGVLLVLNLLLGGVNLLPAYPLDGGRIVRDYAWRRGRSEQAGLRTAAQTGRLTGFLSIGLGVAVLLSGGTTNGAMICLSGWFLILSARSIRDRVRVDELIGGMTVAEAMEPSPVTVQPGLTVDTFAAQLIDGESPMTAVPVADGDEVVGLLGVKEVRRLRPGTWATTRVEDVMAKPPRLVLLAPTEDLPESVAKLTRSGLDGLPVVDDGRIVGVLTRTSLGKIVAARMPAVEPRRGR
jgi:Zn-dependent protease/CBS domain-containing protein